MLNRRRALLIRAAAVVVWMQIGALLMPARAHAASRDICGGPICVDQCVPSDQLCDDLTTGECPHFDACWYEPECNILTDGVAIGCV